MPEHEDECYADGAEGAAGVGEAPGKAGQEEEEGEEVGEGWVGAVVGGFGLFLDGVSIKGGDKGGRVEKYVVVNVAEDFLGGYYEVGHLPDGLMQC